MMKGSESDEDTVYYRLDTSVKFRKSEDENSLPVTIPLPDLCVSPTEHRVPDSTAGYPISCKALLIDSSFENDLVFSSQSTEMDDQTSQYSMSDSDLVVDKDKMPASLPFVDWTYSDSNTSDGSGNVSGNLIADHELSSFDDTDSGTQAKEKKRTSYDAVYNCKGEIPDGIFYHTITAGASIDSGITTGEEMPSLSHTPSSFAVSVEHSRSNILNKRALNASLKGVRYRPYMYSVAGVSLISFSERTRLNDPISPSESPMNSAGKKMYHGTSVLHNVISGDSNWAITEKCNTDAAFVSEDCNIEKILQDRIKLIARIKAIKADIALHHDDYSHNCSLVSSEELDEVTHPDACTSLERLSFLPRTTGCVFDGILSSTISCGAGYTCNPISLSVGGAEADKRGSDWEAEQDRNLDECLFDSMHVDIDGREGTETGEREEKEEGAGAEQEERSDDNGRILMSDETNDGEDDADLCRRDCQSHGYGTVSVTNLLQTVSNNMKGDDVKNKMTERLGEGGSEKYVDDGSSVVLSGPSLSSMYDISWMKLPSPLLLPRPLPRSDDADTGISGTGSGSEHYRAAGDVMYGTDSIINKSDSGDAVIGISDTFDSTDSYEQHSSFTESAALCGQSIDGCDGPAISTKNEIQEVSSTKKIKINGDGSRNNIKLISSDNSSISRASYTFPNLSDPGSIMTNSHLNNFLENQTIIKKISKKSVKKIVNQMDAGCSSTFSPNLHNDNDIDIDTDMDGRMGRVGIDDKGHTRSPAFAHRNNNIIHMSTAQVSPSLRTDIRIKSNFKNLDTVFDLRINFKADRDPHDCYDSQPLEIGKEKDFMVRGVDKQNVNKGEEMKKGKGKESYSFSRRAVRDVPFMCPFPVLKSPIHPLSKYSSFSSLPKQSHSSPQEKINLSSPEDTAMVVLSPLRSTSSSSPSSTGEIAPTHPTLPLPILTER